MKKYPCVYMRGGTSKAVIFHQKDLPVDKMLWRDIFLKVMGTPDVKQIDGMGGTVSSTSKIAVISPSDEEGVDVNYEFFQVDILIARVDDTANCGNISSAVGPFAIDEGLVEPVEPITVVRIRNTNTNKIIEEHVSVENGRAKVHGDEVIKGVPGTGSRIDMYFEEPGGSVTGKLFPTGNKKEMLLVPGYGESEVTIIDCANPVVFIKADELGIKGTELLDLNSNLVVMERVERIRCITAEKIGLVDHWEEARTQSTSIPKVSIVSKPQDYIDLDGNSNRKEDMAICCRAISVGSAHKAYPLTVTIATGAAMRTEGTILNGMTQLSSEQQVVAIGHASGITQVDIKMKAGHVLKGGVTRTARRIMEGYVYVRD
jgi:hypothetical protein